MSLVDIWPVLGITVRMPAIELSVPDQEALEVLARLAAEGIYDPQNRYLPRIPVGGWEDVASPEAERRFLRYYWAAFVAVVYASCGPAVNASFDPDECPARAGTTRARRFRPGWR